MAGSFENETMKDTCIKNFSFLPSDYDCMISFLNDMLKEGWRLKWVKAGFGGFERIDDEHKCITYVVEPYANTSLISLRRLSRTWLNFYTGNEWYYIGKTRGNYIYYANSDSPKPPSNTSSLAVNDSKAKVIATETKRNAAILVIIGFLLYKLLSSKAFMYAFVLTDFYQYAAVVLAVLAAAFAAAIMLYSLETVRLTNGTFSPTARTGLRFGRLYHIRNIAVIAFVLIAFILSNLQTPAILLFLLLPIAALVIGGVIIVRLAHAHKDESDTGKRIMPYAYIVGIITVLLLMFSLTNIQKVQRSYAEQQYDIALAKAATLPHIAYEEHFDGAHTDRVKTNLSHMGDNYLYEQADEARERIVFTNCSVLKSKFAADKIYDYLYSQAEKDYIGSFTKLSDDNGASVHKIEGQEAYLIRSGNTVILTTVQGDAEGINESLTKLLQQLA